MDKDEYRAAYEGRTGADRMALGLSIIPNENRGDMDEVARLRQALEAIRDMDYRGNKHSSQLIAESALGFRLTCQCCGYTESVPNDNQWRMCPKCQTICQ